MRTPSPRTIDVSLAGSVVALLALGLLAVVGSSGAAAPSPRDPVTGPPTLAHGGAATGAAPTPRAASSGLRATIVSAPLAVDVGTSVRLVGLAIGGHPPYSPYWSLATGEVSPGWWANWTAPNETGSVSVLFSLRDSTGAAAVATTTISIVAGPFLEVGNGSTVGDVGLPFRFPVNISGGVGPFRLSWANVAGGSNGSTSAPGDGSFEAAVVPLVPGPVWVLGSIVDADGRTFTAVAPVGEATDGPALVVASVPFAEVGYPTALPVEVAGGTPPFAWSTRAASGISDELPGSGQLTADGSIPVVVTFDRPGPCVVPIELVDGSGEAVGANVSVNVSAGLNLSLAFSPGAPVSGAPLSVRAAIAGGLPPYSYRLALSDAEVTSGNSSSAAPILWTATPVATGYLTLRGSVTDSTGRSTNVSLTIYVGSGGPRAGSGAPVALDGWVALAGAVGGAVAALVGPFAFRRYFRRTVAARTEPGPDDGARSIVRGLLAESEDGIERTTLELLAEERGVRPEALPAVLKFWELAGHLRVENDDGQEFLHWVPRRPAAPTATTSERAPGPGGP